MRKADCFVVIPPPGNDGLYRSATQEEPKIPKGALKPNKMNLLIFLLQHKSATQRKVNRNSAAGNKKITMFISTMKNSSNTAVAHKNFANIFNR